MLESVVLSTHELSTFFGMSQFIAANGLRDTGAVASARAAEIYGLNILADGIQVKLTTDPLANSL